MKNMKMAKGEKHEKAKVLKSIEVRHAETDELESGKSGGHVVTHHFDNSAPGDGYHESEKHGFPEGQGQEMVNHVAEHMKVAMNEPSESEGESTGENQEVA